MSWTQPAFEQIAAVVSRHAGLSFVNREASAEMGIRRAMTRARIPNLEHYLERIACDGNVLDELVNELTVGETYFFREGSHFRYIQQVILPEIRRRRGNRHIMRIWSAACASGEEAYSLAILLEQAGVAKQAHLVATDISGAALCKARKATFEAWSFRGEDSQTALPFLTQSGKRHLLNENIRQQVTFAPLNLALDVYPSFQSGIWGMDLILCRNVLIYFDRETVALVARRLFDTLAEGGWLLTASSDPPLWEKAPFEVVTVEQGVFYRRPEAEVREPEPGVRREEIAVDDVGAVLSTKYSVPGADSPPLLPDEPQQALQRGDYRRVVELTQNHLHDERAAILHVRALANLETADAERVCAQMTARYPLSAELHYLHAILLLNLGHSDDAIRALRRVLYLDRSLAIAHGTLASILRDRGDRPGAMRGFRNMRDLCAQQRPEAVVPLADGERAGRLAEIAGRELTLLETSGG